MTAVFNDTSHSEFMSKQHADLYMRIYQYAAEDFSAVTDVRDFAQAVIDWINSTEDRITRLSQALQEHTHEITPHTHPMPHTHTIPPHTHVGNLGIPVSPAPLTTLQPSNPSTQDNAPLQTQVPQDTQALAWSVGDIPVLPSNTTGATSNFSGNTITSSTSNIGDTTFVHNRRSMTITTLLTPSVPPILTVGS